MRTRQKKRRLYAMVQAFKEFRFLMTGEEYAWDFAPLLAASLVVLILNGWLPKMLFVLWAHIFPSRGPWNKWGRAPFMPRKPLDRRENHTL